MRKAKRSKKMIALVLAGILVMTGSAYAFGIKYRLYSDGYLTSWWMPRLWADDFHFGVSTGIGPYMSDGDWINDPTVYPDRERPTTPGVREVTKDTIPVVEKIHKHTKSIDKTGKNIDQTEIKTRDLMEKITKNGEDRLVHSSNVSDANGDVFQKDGSDLSKYQSVINPERRKELDDLSKMTSSDEWTEKVKDFPITDVKDYMALSDPAVREESDKKAYEYFQKVSQEAMAARVEIFDELKELEAQAEKLVGTDSRSTMTDKQRELMLEALDARTKQLLVKVDHIEKAEEEVYRKYKNKQRMETAALSSGAIWYPSYDPYNPSERDAARFRSTATNFGIMSFKKSE